MSDIRRGLIMVNTGPGKGKTTAAMGTALRAVGQGMRVLMLQFLKGSWHYGELDAVQAFGDKFIMKQMGRGFVKVGAEKPDPEDVRMVEGGRISPTPPGNGPRHLDRKKRAPDNSRVGRHRNRNAPDQARL
jgi:hypothetical protein